MKSVLITGANSYIGNSVRDYLKQWTDKYSVVVKDTMNWTPKVSDFEEFDVVFHVAGIAHRKETKENAYLYYEINRDLAIKVAAIAKEAGVGQFVVMSTMSVYGLTTGYITKKTKPFPRSSYGNSKLQADRAIWKMRDSGFRVAVLRPPIVYGKGCKGNYQSFRSFVLKSPVFPESQNQRSMLYIGNLCWFVKDVIENSKSGLFFPQNDVYTNTSEMAKVIAECHSKKIKLTKAFSWGIGLAPVNIVKKVFGDLTYEKVDLVSEYGLEESIRLTEDKEIKLNKLNLWIYHHYATTPDRNGYIRPFRFAKHLEKKNIKTIIFASSYHHWADINVIEDGHPHKIEYSDGVPFVFIKTPSSAAGSIARIKNMFSFAVGVDKEAKKIEQKLGKPDVILASSPHPLALIAGIRVAKKYHIPCICEIRDLWPDAIFYGSRLNEKSIAGKILVAGEHWIYKKATALIFTKEGDTDYLKDHHWTTAQGGDIDLNKCFYINNGIEYDQYQENIVTNTVSDKDLEGGAFRVIYAGAIRPVNNVGNIVEAARLLKTYDDIKFIIYGDGNQREDLEKKVLNYRLKNVVFKGFIENKYIPYVLSRSSVNLLNYSSENYNWSRGNSSNKLFEYLASGKPVISTVKTGYSIIQKYDCGIEMESQSPEGLADAIKQVKSLDKSEYERMCDNAKNGAKDFDYSILTEKLMETMDYAIKKYRR